MFSHVYKPGCTSAIPNVSVSVYRTVWVQQLVGLQKLKDFLIIWCLKAAVFFKCGLCVKVEADLAHNVLRWNDFTLQKENLHGAKSVYTIWSEDAQIFSNAVLMKLYTWLIAGDALIKSCAPVWRSLRFNDGFCWLYIAFCQHLISVFPSAYVKI